MSKEKAVSIKTGKEASDRQNFWANEVCYGLSVAAQLGLSKEESIKYIMDDLIKWSKKALPKGEK